jgi:hypothetical protein
MASSYIGSDAAFFGSLSLMTGGDRPTASVFRVPLERLLDNCAYLEARMIDMLAGGTYNPTGDITIGTSKLRLSVSKARSISAGPGTWRAEACSTS